MGFRRSASKVRREAVIDIGSHAVKALVFERERSGKIAGAAKKLVSVLPTVSGSLRTAIKLKKLLLSLGADPNLKPDFVTIGVGHAAASCSLESWSEKREKAGPRITHRELADLFGNALSVRRESEPKLLAYPLGVSINGYPVRVSLISEDGAGLALIPCREKQAASPILFKVIRTVVSPEIVEQLEGFRIQWEGTNMEIVPLARAYQEALVTTLGVPDAMLVDVGGEQTSLMHMKGGTLLWMDSFPIGAHRAVRALAQELGSFADAEDEIRSYAGGMGANAATVRIREVLERTSVSWRDGLVAALDAAYQWGPISGEILLTGGGAGVPEIASALRESGWIRKFSYVEAPAVQIVSGNRFFEGHSLGGVLTGPDDTGLAALVCYVMRKRQSLL